MKWYFYSILNSEHYGELSYEIKNDWFEITYSLQLNGKIFFNIFFSVVFFKDVTL